MNFENKKIIDEIKPPEDLECRDCPLAVWRLMKNVNAVKKNNIDIQVDSFYLEKHLSNNDEFASYYFNTIECYCSKLFKTTFSASVNKYENKKFIANIDAIDYVIDCEAKGE